jgi:hypothetical protein
MSAPTELKEKRPVAKPDFVSTNVVLAKNTHGKAATPAPRGLREGRLGSNSEFFDLNVAINQTPSQSK